MATIQLTGDLGLDANVNLAPFSSLLKYFQQLPALQLTSGDFSQASGLTLDQPALTALSSGLAFDKTVAIGPDTTANAGGGEPARCVFRRHRDRGRDLLRRLRRAGGGGRFGCSGCGPAPIRSGPGPELRHPELSEFSAKAGDHASRRGG